MKVWCKHCNRIILKDRYGYWHHDYIADLDFSVNGGSHKAEPSIKKTVKHLLKHLGG